MPILECPRCGGRCILSEGTKRDRCGRCGENIVVPEGDRPASGPPPAPPPRARPRPPTAVRRKPTPSPSEGDADPGWSDVERGLGPCFDALWLASSAFVFLFAWVVAWVVGADFRWVWAVGAIGTFLFAATLFVWGRYRCAQAPDDEPLSSIGWGAFALVILAFCTGGAALTLVIGWVALDHAIVVLCWGGAALILSEAAFLVYLYRIGRRFRDDDIGRAVAWLAGAGVAYSVFLVAVLLLGFSKLPDALAVAQVRWPHLLGLAFVLVGLALYRLEEERVRRSGIVFVATGLIAAIVTTLEVGGPPFPLLAVGYATVLGAAILVLLYLNLLHEARAAVSRG